ncbi:MAG: hypothetical protein KKA65_00490 [Nanoarchaeota archaeon]|nr:hypothetical protein [Nanoarchaeota archaeon]
MYLNPQGHKQIKIGSIVTSKKEMNDLFKAWLAISLAFAIVLGGFSFSINFVIIFMIAALTVGTGFIVHELGHKLVAQHYGCFAEFRAFNMMLWLAVIMSFFGFVFAAPGAVMISGPVGVRRNGKISMAGPLVNLVFALCFLALLLIPVIGLLKTLAGYGFLINTWLGLFNLLPFGNFDGKKILAWNKVVYGVMAGVAFVLMAVQGYVR